MITDFLLYLGSLAENNIAYFKSPSNVKEMFKGDEGISINELTKVFAYYKKAYEIHPENEGITQAYNRLSYLLNDYVYGKTSDSTTCCELRATGLYIKSGLIKKTTVFYPYSDIEQIDIGAISSNITLYVKGQKIKLSILDEAQKISSIAKNALSGRLCRPRYEELLKKKLVQTSRDSGLIAKKYTFVTYYNYNNLINMLNKLNEY